MLKGFGAVPWVRQPLRALPPAPTISRPQDKVQVGQGAVGPDEKAPPEHRVNVSDPGMDQVNFGLGRLFHGGVSLPAGQRLGSFLVPGLKCSPTST
jgi:hypothetical protein